MNIDMLINAKKNTFFTFKKEDNQTIFNAWLRNKKILSTLIDGTKLELTFLNFVTKDKKLKNKQFSILIKQFGLDYEIDFLYKFNSQELESISCNPKIFGNIYNLNSSGETFDLSYYKNNTSKYFYLHLFNVNNFEEICYKGIKYEFN